MGSKRFTEFVLDNGWFVDYPTEPSGVLRLGPGPVAIQARLSERDRAEDGWFAVIDCELRLADAEGKLWEATASFLSRWLLYPLIDLARPVAGRWLRNAPQEWRDALKKPLLADIPAAYDDRFYRHVWIDNTYFSLQFKYLPASFRVAALGPDKFVVQVGELFCCWNPVVVAGADGEPLPVPPRPRLSDEELEKQMEQWEEAGLAGDYEHIPPLAYEIDAGQLLFRNALFDPQREDDVLSDRPVNAPLVFRRARGKGTPQRAIAFHPDARPRAVRIEGGGDFATLTWEVWTPLEFATDAGGRLLVEGGKHAVGVRLDRHPGSEAGPMDVLRCCVRLADEAGDLWEGVALFTPDFFFEKLVDLDATEWTAWETDERPWRPGPQVLAGVRCPLDDGAWRYLIVGADVVAFRADGQRPLIDVDFSGTRFAVRITGLVGRRRPGNYEDRYFELDPEDRRDELAAWDSDRELPPLRFNVAFAELAFRNTTFAVDEGFWHRNAIPIPVVFTRVGRSEPNGSVRFVPDTP